MNSADKNHVTSFEDKLDELQGILNKFKSYVHSKEDDCKGAHFHSFGPENLHMEMSKVTDIVTGINKSYNMIKSINNPSMVMKLVNEKQAMKLSLTPGKAKLQNAIKKIRNATKNTSLKVVLWKLEAIAAEEKLDFDFGPHSNCFISSDMFYIEVLMKNDGSVDDVTLHGHTGEPKSCKDMVDMLKSQNYEGFRAHLHGLKALTNLQGDTFIKSNILSALEILENDIVKVMNAHPSQGNLLLCIMKGPFGFVRPRIGGKSLCCTYGISPLHLINTKQNDKQVSFSEGFDSSKGYNVCVSVCQSNKTLLPNSPLMSVEANSVVFGKQDGSNSVEVPANFLLRFDKPLPVSLTTLKRINSTLGKGESSFSSSKQPLAHLILTQFLDLPSKDILKKKYPTVLGDSVYNCRYTHQEDSGIYGVLLSNIPFTHPKHLYDLIQIFRCEAIFNILLSSCFYNIPGDECDIKNTYNYDVSVTGENVIVVTFTHPLDQTLSSLEFITSENGDLKCMLNLLPASPVVCTNDYLTKVVNRCMSIPITLRCVYKKAACYKPEVHKIPKPVPSKKPSHKPLTLLMPSLSQIHNLPSLASPHLTASPSTFLTFSASGISPSTPVFAFDSTQKQPMSRKRRNSVTTPGSTQSSDGNRTPNKFKLPKITLKRRRNKIYEIDQTKSDLSESDSTPVTTEPEKVSDISPFLYTSNQAITTNNVSEFQKMDPTASLFEDTTAMAFGDLPMESDIDSLLGIPSQPFIHTDQLVGEGSSSVPAFDLDALTSSVTSTFDADNPNVIDPSELVRSSADAFDLSSSVALDIDSLMNEIS